MARWRDPTVLFPIVIGIVILAWVMIFLTLLFIS
jgi:hypothetical protein